MNSSSKAALVEVERLESSSRHLAFSSALSLYSRSIASKRASSNRAIRQLDDWTRPISAARLPFVLFMKLPFLLLIKPRDETAFSFP
jgi:hypothetical protein